MATRYSPHSVRTDRSDEIVHMVAGQEHVLARNSEILADAHERIDVWLRRLDLPTIRHIHLCRDEVQHVVHRLLAVASQQRHFDSTLIQQRQQLVHAYDQRNAKNTTWLKSEVALCEKLFRFNDLHCPLILLSFVVGKDIGEYVLTGGDLRQFSNLLEVDGA